MQLNNVVIAAPHSNTGKTLITCGLLKIMKKRFNNVISFKCGPDYIDPLFHKKVLAVTSYNLDSFFLVENELRQMYIDKYQRFNAQISITEGVMGLFDGLAGVSERASTYDIARIINSPIILVIDAKGMSRSILALVSGFLNYDTLKLIKGVILNRTTKSTASILKPLIEEELGIKVYGYVENDANMAFDSRYLGLKLPTEIDELEKKLEVIAEKLEESLDIEGIIECAMLTDSDDANKTVIDEDIYCKNLSSNNMFNNYYLSKEVNKIRIAVALDEAFCFYYEDNFDILREHNVEIVPFSPLHDKKLPDNIQGIILGGGYPELFAKTLSENISMKEDIYNKIVMQKLPSLAECGGFMYLHKGIYTEDNNYYEMVGILPKNVQYKGKLVRFGYISLYENVCKEKDINLYMDNKIISDIKAHEFHYYDSEDNGEDFIARKPLSKRNWMCIHKGANYMWGFPHLYYRSSKELVEWFIEGCQSIKTLL